MEKALEHEQTGQRQTGGKCRFGALIPFGFLHSGGHIYQWLMSHVNRTTESWGCIMPRQLHFATIWNRLHFSLAGTSHCFFHFQWSSFFIFLVTFLLFSHFLPQATLPQYYFSCSAWFSFPAWYSIFSLFIYSVLSHFHISSILFHSSPASSFTPHTSFPIQHLAELS